jgi:zinc transporter ZupT
MQNIYKEVFNTSIVSSTNSVIKQQGSKLFNKENITSFLLLLALSLHAFFEGIALGLLKEDREIFYMILAVSFHKWVEALSIVLLNFNTKF